MSTNPAHANIHRLLAFMKEHAECIMRDPHIVIELEDGNWCACIEAVGEVLQFDDGSGPTYVAMQGDSIESALADMDTYAERALLHFEAIADAHAMQARRECVYQGER